VSLILSKKHLFPIRSLFEVLMFVVTIGLAAFAWWTLSQVFVPIAGVGSQMIQDFGTNNTLTDATETFFTNTNTYILILILVVGVVWVFVYSQRRGREVV